MQLYVNLENHNYNVIIKNKLIDNIDDYIKLNSKIIIMYDENIPNHFLNIILSKYNNIYTYEVKSGEKSKSFVVYNNILKTLIDLNFSRNDYIIAFGGGVVGDLSGFVAATFKRGCHFINIPTTTISMIDSSIGGKVAINFENIKNVVGTFYQPEQVLIDPLLLESLDKRHFYSGLVEALKAGIIGDKKLYQLFKDNIFVENIEEVIYRSLVVKKKFVEIDQFDHGIRKMLNFGHTIGHAIESYYHLGEVYHGEAVAIGMVYMIDNINLKADVKNILKNMNINLNLDINIDKLYEFIKNDKKANSNMISLIKVKDIEEVEIIDVEIKELKTIMEGGFNNVI